MSQNIGCFFQATTYEVSVNKVFLLYIFKFFAFFKYVLKIDVNGT